MRKVLLIKIEAPSYSSIGMENCFKEMYEEVESIDWQAQRFNHGLDGLWVAIVNKCETFKPDLIFCQFQRDILTTHQFKKLSEYGFVINYTEDVREDIQWIEDAAPHIGLTIFTNMDDVEKLSANGIHNVAYMMVSYNHEWYRPQPKTCKYYGHIVFIGNNYVGTNLNFPEAQERQDMIAFMKGKFGDIFQAYGMGQANPMLSPAHAIEAYNNSKVVITQNNFKRKRYCSDRGLNAMGCGAVTIHQYFDGINEMFKDAPHLSIWKNLEGLATLCDYYLLEGHTNRDAIFEYTLEKHNWINRIKFIQAALFLMEHDKQIWTQLN